MALLGCNTSYPFGEMTASNGEAALGDDAREAEHHGWVVPEGFFDLHVHAVRRDFRQYATDVHSRRLGGMAAAGLRQS